MPTGSNTLARRAPGIAPSPQSTRPGSAYGAPVSDAAAALIAEYGGKVEIKQGPHIETVVPFDVKKFDSDVVTLDGKIV